jgi:aspartate racemase
MNNADRTNPKPTRRIGIVVHSAEGGTLCFITACREGQEKLGPHMHPEIVVSAIPMALSMPAWESADYDAVGRLLRRGVEQVAAAGADFYICPDNTAHLVLERIAETLPIPGLHIADVVALEMKSAGWRTAGLLGTKWTMTGPVYPRALQRLGLTARPPGETLQEQINRAIFDELCQGSFRPQTTQMFIDAIRELADAGADCVILGCTEIPLIINPANSPLPVLDSTRLLAKYAVLAALAAQPPVTRAGWLALDSCLDPAESAGGMGKR